MMTMRRERTCGTEQGWHAEAHTFGSGMVITTYLSGAIEQARARLTNRRTG
jgi:hypothetical protein